MNNSVAVFIAQHIGLDYLNTEKGSMGNVDIYRTNKTVPGLGDYVCVEVPEAASETVIRWALHRELSKYVDQYDCE